MRCAVGDKSDFRFAAGNHFWSRNKGPRRLKLATEALHVLLKIVGTLALLRLLVMSAASGKECGSGMIGAWQSSISDTIPVNILIASETAKAVQVFLAEDFAAIQRFLGIMEGLGHPIIHAEVE